MRHTGEACWCNDMGDREQALDRLYPDRCQIDSEPGTPFGPRSLCVLPAGHERRCFGHLQRPGGPCHFCGAVYEGDECPTCWTDLSRMAFADMKAMFAECAPDLSLDVDTGPTS